MRLRKELAATNGHGEGEPPPEDPELPPGTEDLADPAKVRPDFCLSVLMHKVHAKRRLSVSLWA